MLPGDDIVATLYTTGYLTIKEFDRMTKHILFSGYPTVRSDAASCRMCCVLTRVGDGSGRRLLSQSY